MVRQAEGAVLLRRLLTLLDAEGEGRLLALLLRDELACTMRRMCSSTGHEYVGEPC